MCVVAVSFLEIGDKQQRSIRSEIDFDDHDRCDRFMMLFNIIELYINTDYFQVFLYYVQGKHLIFT